MMETVSLKRRQARDTVEQTGAARERLRIQSALIACDTETGGDVRLTIRRDLALDICVALMDWVRVQEDGIRLQRGRSTLDANLHAARIRLAVRDLTAALAVATNTGPGER